MKKVMTIAAVALMMTGTSAFACSGCGCSAKKSDKASCEAKEGKSSCDSKEAKESKGSCGSSCSGKKA